MTETRPPPPNQRIIAIGDIHGCLTALATLIGMLDLREGDLLVTLGDYVDRGPDTRHVLDQMVELFDAGRVIPLRGNHELMMMRARDSVSEERFWRSFGGDDALESYSTADRQGRLQDVPDRHWRFMASDCRDWYETDEFIFVHAGVNPWIPLEQQIEDDLFWRTFADRPHLSGKLVICGHSVQQSGVPKNLGHTVCIDTGVYAGGWLTALDVQTHEYWQANDFGETRKGTLDPAVPRFTRRS
jgi:serine/threonine protein phosphatase 1